MIALKVRNEIADYGVSAGVISAAGVTVSPSEPALHAKLAALVTERSQGDFPPAELKDKVRDLLRAGGFKPSGRIAGICGRISNGSGTSGLTRGRRRPGRFTNVRSAARSTRPTT